ncbi:RND efflux system, membrane fusion protein CmeA [Fimbriiglobus ruber]|uniref:RND efflux system, membrane fusion protein CmeA n=1 Tax=Fimbriiglobus ruber TaxID=1908690 RepID=A0A225DUU5_9BACT|nr:RND efflux system, membrane fusion protein CmeA [Fimbriiglobus ruber]
MFLVVLACSTIRADDPPKADSSKKEFVFDGRFEADAVSIRPLVTGYLTRIPVAEGSVVRAGDVIAEIDPRPYQAKLDRAKAHVEAAIAKTKTATITLDQAKNLAANKVKSANDVAVAQVAADVTTAELEAAKADMTLAQLNLSWTRLTAPSGGRVGRLTSTLGGLLVADEVRPLVTIVDAEQLAVVFYVSEHDLLHFRRDGLDKPKKLTVEVGLSDETGFPHPAEVTFVDTAVNPRTGTIHVRARCENPNGLISPGMSARVRLSVPTAK